MATPTLLGFPTELLLEIIPHVLPEGFESLALTCKTIYELCTPFIERHNHLCSQFHKFRYREYSRDPSLSPIRTAFDLITRIAIEPTVARYLRHVDLSRDSYPRRARPWPCVPDVDSGAPVVALLADSPYLRQAGLDWKEYYALVVDNFKVNRYSPHAAAFILTLLPNVKTLTLPTLWKPLHQTEKLLDVIVRETKRSNFPWDRPSLAQVTRFKSFGLSGADGHRFGFGKSIPFLALPDVRVFHRPDTVAIGDDVSITLASNCPYRRYGETLEAVHLVNCCIDEVAIADFLKRTPHLRTLKYSHSTMRDADPQDWDICKFVTAIEREAGSHLEELYISISRLHGSIPPGKTSMRGFQRLRKLQFPLEIAMCNLNEASSRVATPDGCLTGQELDEPFVGDLVPASVAELSLLSGGTDHHKEALKAMFFDFAAKKNSQLPGLREIYLPCPAALSVDAYKKECEKLVPETEKVGVVLKITNPPGWRTISWDSNW